MALLNHYGTAENLSAATGIPARSLRAVFTTVELQGKGSRKLESADYVEGFRRARHRMTDHMRRVVQKSKAGAYQAPIIRTPTNVLAPQREKYMVEARGKQIILDSHWMHYNVEFMSDDEIWQLLYTAFDTFMATGQFNLARLVFLADSSEYPGEHGFKDRDYRRDAEANEVISMGSRVFPFPEFVSPKEFADFVLDEWMTLVLKGAIRMTKIYFTQDDAIASGSAMRMAQDEFNRIKKRAKRGKGNNGTGRKI